MNDTAPVVKAKPVKKRKPTVVVEMKHLKKSFGSNDVLVDINLVITKGESVVVLGKSGTGKSVLIKCIVGLVDIDAGSLMILGRNISELGFKDLKILRRRIGFLFQSGALYDSMTVRENLEFPLRRQKRSISDEKMNALVMEALQNVGLTKAIDLMPSELSGGMRKRLGLARTLILKPAIMLYDEPTTGLDPITSKEISKLILDIQDKYNTTSVIVTHDIECTRLTADRIIVLKEGMVTAIGSFNQLKKSPDKFVRSFFI